jgi:hypothetical protein
VIDDVDLKRMGLFDDTGDIYEIDKNLLYYRTDDQPKKSHLHYEKNA